MKRERECVKIKRNLIEPYNTLKGENAKMQMGYWTDFSKSAAKMPLYITVCGSVIQHESHTPQGAPYYMLALSIKGAGRYETAKESVTLTPGRAILLPPNAAIYLRPLTKDWQISYINFSGSEAHEIFSDLTFGAYTPSNAEEIRATISEIAALPRTRRQAQGRKLLYDLLLSVREDLLQTPIPLEKKENESAIYRMVFYIEEHFREKITLDILSNISGLHKKTVNALFRRRFGMSPIAYVVKTRYCAADEMLKSSPELSISEIAKRCGFRSLSFFYRNFPKAITPLEFRKQFKSMTYFPED